MSFRFRKKNIIVRRTLAKIVEKIKVTKLTYFIASSLCSKKTSARSLYRSSFSKQLGINCTCEQIGLFLISTRGCGSHSWKLLKSPICSRVQLIPNCFSNRPISYTNPGLALAGFRKILPCFISTRQPDMSPTGHNIKWDHFEILASGQCDLQCKIKETLLIRDLKPALNENVGSENLLLY